MFRFRVNLVLALLLAAVAAPAAAQPVAPPTGSGQELQVFLLTMGQGDQVWEKFGHNALWVHDPVGGTDRVYNYGVFDFHSPGYWSRFVRGNWIYQLAADDIYGTVAQYQYLNRTLTAQELNLTAEQKAQLQAYLEWNVQPQNREYRYDYFRDNCSTRIRDALDRVLDGQLRAATADVLTETTYRWHSRRLIADDELAYSGMHAGLGPAADQRISAWEEMFLPGKVRERVAELRVRGSGGELVPLVASERVLYQAVARAPEREAPPQWVHVFLLIGALVGGTLGALAWATPGSAIARFAFAALASAWTLTVGFGGVLLVALWAWTDHTVAYANENLLHFNPLDLSLALLLPALAYGVRWAARPARWLAFAVAGISLLGAVLQLLPGMYQVNAEIVALLLPVHLALAWAAWWLGEREGTTGNREQVEGQAAMDGRRPTTEDRRPATGRLRG